MHYRRSILDSNYPNICNTVTSSGLTSLLREKFISLNIPTSLIDSQELDLELDRHPVLQAFCHPDKEENWEDLFEYVPDNFVEDINTYARDNLIKLRVFISTPFATEYTRSIETTRTIFIANIGGDMSRSAPSYTCGAGLMGLCVGFSLVSAAEIIYYLPLSVFSLIRSKPQDLGEDKLWAEQRT